jgi:hypothetical protein
MGYITEEKMKLTRDITMKYISKSTADIPVDDFYTNAYLPGVFPPKK